MSLRNEDEENRLYFSTMYKDYRIVGNNQFRKNIIDNTYHGTKNITDAVIIENNKYGHFALFTTKSGIFYTDPRIKYKDIKKPFISDDAVDFEMIQNTDFRPNRHHHDDEEEDNNNYEESKQEEKDDDDYNYNAMNVSLCILSNDEWDSERMKMLGVDTSIHDEVIIKLLIQNDGNIYALNNFGHIYSIYLKTSESNGDINKLIQEMDEKCANYKLVKSDRDGRIMIGYVHKDDPNKKNATFKFGNKCDQKLLKESLIGLRVINKFDVQIKKHYFMVFIMIIIINILVLNQRMQYQKHNKNESEFGSVLYLCRQKYGAQGGWKIKFIFNGIDQKLVNSYKYLYKSFIEDNQYLLKEECYCMFIDDTNISNKKIMIICGKYLIVIPVLNIHKTEKNDDDHHQYETLFGSVYPLKEILPNIDSINIRGAKFIYSYLIKTLFIFERLSSSSKYPFKLTRIGLDSFQFEAYQQKHSKR